MTKSDSAETLSFVLIESSALMIGVELLMFADYSDSLGADIHRGKSVAIRHNILQTSIVER
jgi:hypothetical protein